ncbi:MAG: SiaB family protein kinase [Flammeovirgaceae bacterium]
MKESKLLYPEIRDFFSVHRLKRDLKYNNIYMSFSGVFSQDILTLIGLSLRRIPNSGIVSRRLFALVIEMTQNIYHYSNRKVYSEKDKRYIGTGTIAIGEDGDHHVISSGNFMDTSKTERLIKRSSYINSLDEKELKEYYLAQRKIKRDDGMPGANLGLIDMRRKSKNLLGIHIEKVDEKDSFFILSIRIKKG